MTSPTPRLAPDELVTLYRSYAQARVRPRNLPRRLRDAIVTAEPDTLVTMLERAAHEAAAPQHLHQLLRDLQRSNDQLQEQLRRLSQPPHCLARLLRFDAATNRAIVATGPNARTEVAVHDELSPDELIVGRDVILTAERNCVLRTVARDGAAGPFGGGRLARFGAFVDGCGGPDDGQRTAYAVDARGETLVSIPRELAERIEALLAEGGAPPRLCIDELGWAFAFCDGEGDDPRAAAARFAIDLDPIGADQVIGLEHQRRHVERVVAHVDERGGFVLCEGATGSGKTHLARHALHLLQQRGETVVLGLQSSHDHRYVGQEESDVAALFDCARAMTAAGKKVLLFLDEIDKFFFRSRYGQSVHVNSTRATWLQQLGTATGLQGVLVYATTNKAAALPDELLNRVTQPLSFGGVDRAQAMALLLHFLPPRATPAADREATVDALAAWTHDRLADAAVATVTLRDQSERTLHACDLRQVSARFFHEVALRIGDAAAEHGPLSDDRAVAVLADHLEEVTRGLGLSTENLAERTFVEFAPRNPPEFVRVLTPRPGPGGQAAAGFSYELTEGGDGPAF